MGGDEITEEELAALMAGAGPGYPSEKEKASIFEFFSKVLAARKNKLSKVSNLRDNEIIALNELRKGSVYSRVMDLDEVGEFFDEETDAYLALADSREGFLVNMAVTTKKEVSSKKAEKKAGKWPWQR